MIYRRRKTRQIRVGNAGIGSDYPVSIQSMTNTDTRDVASTIRQINNLVKAGCEIVRISIPDDESAEKVRDIVSSSVIPVIGDIHFDYRLALKAIASGIHGIRINPGNIGDENNIKAVAEAAGSAGIPIRVGSNSGSLAKEFRRETRNAAKAEKIEQAAESLVLSALKQCRLLENYGFRNIKVSLKSSDVLTTIAAYRKFALMADYPLHLGITEAGRSFSSAIKSSIGIGSLLADGIGDTIRVSVTGDPSEEIAIAIAILETIGLRPACPEIISCPTCARTTTDIVGLVTKIENEIASMKNRGTRFKPFKIAIMGCAVNGPGEAKDADIGIAGTSGGYVIFKDGIVIGKCNEQEAFNKFFREIENFRETTEQHSRNK